MKPASRYRVVQASRIAIFLSVGAAAVLWATAPPARRAAAQVPPPTITTITPNFGPASGGTPVTIIGTNFVPGETRFTATADGPDFTNVSCSSTTQCAAVTPAYTFVEPGRAERAAVFAIANGQFSGISGSGNFLFYAAPVLESLSPSVGPATGGTVVTLSGGTFPTEAESDRPTPTVRFGSAVATGVSCANSTSCTATAPLGSGTVQVTIETVGGTSNGLSFTQWPAPQITAISPSSGPASGDTVVMIVGTVLPVAPAPTVRFGNAVAANVICDPVSCMATAPPGTGTVQVTIETVGGTSNGVPYTYVQPPPTISSITPNFGPTGGGTTVTITGTNFSTELGETLFGLIDPTVGFVSLFTDVQCPSTTSCTATSGPRGIVPGSAGANDIHARVNNVISEDSVRFVWYGEPEIDSISPTSGPAAGGTVVTIAGGVFPTGTAEFPGPVPTVRFGSTPATNVSCPNEATCMAAAPLGNGTVQVTIETPGGTSNGVPFTYIPALTVTAITPTSGPAAGGTAVTLTGAGFQPNATVSFGGTPASAVTVVNATTLQVTTPPHAPGAVAVTVTTPGAGTATLPDAFTYLAPPSITGLSPSSGPEAGGTPVTISGQGFVPGETDVAFGPTPATSVTCPSTTLCQAVSPPGAGTVSVHVTVLGQTSPATATFIYEPPPPQPMSVTGQVWRQIPPIVSEGQIEGTVVPVVGGVVEALVGGTVCGQGVTDSQGRVQLVVAADPPARGCGRPGLALTFRVNGAAAAGDAVTFQSGGQAAVTLILPGPMPPPRR